MYFLKLENIKKMYFNWILRAAVTLTQKYMIRLNCYHYRRRAYCLTAVVKRIDKMPVEWYLQSPFCNWKTDNETIRSNSWSQEKLPFLCRPLDGAIRLCYQGHKTKLVPSEGILLLTLQQIFFDHCVTFIFQQLDLSQVHKCHRLLSVHD